MRVIPALDPLEHHKLRFRLRFETPSVENGVDLPKLKTVLKNGLLALRKNVENLPALATRATPQQVGMPPFVGHLAC